MYTDIIEIWTEKYFILYLFFGFFLVLHFFNLIEIKFDKKTKFDKNESLIIFLSAHDWGAGIVQSHQRWMV